MPLVAALAPLGLSLLSWTVLPTRAAQAQVALNTTQTLTTSTSTNVTNRTETQEQFRTRVTAVRNGVIVFDETANAAPGSPAVNDLEARATAQLTGPGCTVSPFAAVETSRTLTGSTTTDTLTDTVETSELTETIGPATIIVGNLDTGGTPFVVERGTLNVDEHFRIRREVLRTTTNIFLNFEHRQASATCTPPTTTTTTVPPTTTTTTTTTVPTTTTTTTTTVPPTTTTTTTTTAPPTTTTSTSTTSTSTTSTSTTLPPKPGSAACAPSLPGDFLLGIVAANAGANVCVAIAPASLDVCVSRSSGPPVRGVVVSGATREPIRIGDTPPGCIGTPVAEVHVTGNPDDFSIRARNASVDVTVDNKGITVTTPTRTIVALGCSGNIPALASRSQANTTAKNGRCLAL